MREGHASRTAEQNALFRALESSRPERERVCHDPLARHFLTWPLTLVTRLAAIPGAATFVAIDFKRDDLTSAMRSAGYRDSARTFILWEGVTNYLTDGAVDSTLRWCSGASADSLLLFTYVHRDVLTHPSSYTGTKNLFAS